MTRSPPRHTNGPVTNRLQSPLPSTTTIPSIGQGRGPWPVGDHQAGPGFLGLSCNLTMTYRLCKGVVIIISPHTMDRVRATAASPSYQASPSSPQTPLSSPLNSSRGASAPHHWQSAPS
ncbi:hypothetical protein NLI96_g11616 [Meripilus lineatus]|uniref:Uncharacterized protein n=1 Tax=Meripilus lineatus TaxID=2056292 RepID=A0AAD5URM1_9APHY|nr:hypothetical protein NLI96_g11616 [Physisporinus lineatus]